MPYIKPKRRTELEPAIEKLAEEIESVGELNYAITRLLLRYVGSQSGYAHYNELIGVLECAKQEFYRRAVAEYEDEKAQENGDVY